MGCCTSTPDSVPLISPGYPEEESLGDPGELKFGELFVRGDPGDVVPTRDVASAMGLSAVATGRMVSSWGYQTGRRYVDGRRERVIIGIKARS